MTAVKIQQRDKTDNRLRDQNELYAQMIDEIHVGVVLIEPETKNIINVNKTAVEMIGASKEQIIGKICHEYICPAEKGKCPITDLGQKVDNSEKVLLTADGESIPVLKTVTKVTLGGKEYILDSFIDITMRKQAEEKLRIKDFAFDSSLSADSIGNNDGFLTHANLVFARIWGYENVDEVIGKPILDFLADKNKALEIIESINNTGKWEGEYTAIRKDGSTFIALSSANAVYDTEGNQTALYSSVVDITERKRGEEKLQESEEKFRAITDTAQDAIIMIDNDGKIILWNNTSEKMFGYTSDEAIGRDCHKLIAPENYLDSINKGLAKFKETGKGNAIGKTLQLNARKKNGDEFPVEISLSTFKIKNKWNAVGIIRDITQQIQAHKVQADIIAQYTTMINTVPAMMYLKNVENRYIIVNNQFCLNVGKTMDQIIDKTDYDLFPKEKAEKIFAEDKRVMEDGVEVINKEEYVKDDQGNIQWLSVTKIPLRDSQDEITGGVGLIQDVTEYHRSREQLIQSDKLAAIGTLAAGVAHEINNPIGYINSNLNTMSKYIKKIAKHFDDNKAQGSEETEHIKEIIDDFDDAINESKEGADRVKKIVADLKSFSRVDRAKKEHANINEGIESTLNIVWNELKYNCKVEKELGDLPELYCILSQLNQVFMNLLVNAGQAITGKSGLIKIKTWADDKNIYVSIKDNGSGIPDENIKKIFEPFFTTKEVGKGTGLGLSLVFDIIKKHNGKIDVKSEVGVGTEFTITLPLEGIGDA